MSRGHYGRTHVGGERSGGSSKLWWIAVLGGATLWARHQGKQINALNSAMGLPRQSFLDSVKQDAKGLSSAARAKLSGLEHRLSAGKRG